MSRASSALERASSTTLSREGFEHAGAQLTTQDPDVQCIHVLLVIPTLRDDDRSAEQDHDQRVEVIDVIDVDNRRAVPRGPRQTVVNRESVIAVLCR